MKRTFYYGWMFFAFILIGSSTVAQEKITKDSIKKATKELPLEPKRPSLLPLMRVLGCLWM